MYEKWSSHPIRFVAMTGYVLEDFLGLPPYFEKVHHQYFSRHDISGKREKQQRKFVVYRNSPLPTVADRLAFILGLTKLNPIQEQHADWFDMTQKQCNAFIHGLAIVLEQSLGDACAMPATTAGGLWVN